MTERYGSIGFLLAGAFLLTLSVGCRNATPPPESTSQTPSASTSSRPAAEGQAADADATGDDQSADSLAALQKWTGDLDGMIKRGFIRVLTVHSKTTFFVDKGAQMGLVVDAFRLFEDDLNKKLERKHVRVRVIFVPVAADELLPALADGRGDVVAAGKVFTAWRKRKWTSPTRPEPASPPSS